MRLYIFRSDAKTELRAFAADMTGSKLPEQFHPCMPSMLCHRANTAASQRAGSRGARVKPEMVENPPPRVLCVPRTLSV
jgi:hypothetical protein